MKPLKVFIGWDSREKVAYEVLQHSIEKHTNAKEIEIIPLYHKELRNQGYFKRPWEIVAGTGNYRDLVDGKPFSTEFSHTRFLIPELMGFDGWALFMDCDMLFTDDIRDLFKLCDDKYAVMCVKHRQEITSSKKMDGSVQEAYFRKNWSSFMLINCGHEANKSLTKEVVNTEDGGWLHRFGWLEDKYIGELPGTYNWIVDSPVSVSSGGKPKMIHYTYGGPWFDGYNDVPFADEWWKYYQSFIREQDIPEPASKLNKVDYRNINGNKKITA